MSAYEYGHLATLGIAVPQANPTVEPEMAALMPDGVNVIATRLRGSRTDSKSRLLGYLENLEETLDAYDTASLDAAGYACTGSSYIVGEEADATMMARMQDRFGYPVISAAAAIKQAVAHLGATRIAVFAPYPQWLADLSITYWQNVGFDVVAHAAAPLDPSDTRSVYGIHSNSIMANIEKLALESADLLLLTGTGMPTVRAIGAVATRIGKPVLSSNLCLAWAMQRTVGLNIHMPPPTLTEPLFGGWRHRLRA